MFRSKSIDSTARPGNFDAEAIREAVRERYAAVGADPGSAYSFRVGKEFAEALGYPAELVARLPASATEVFTGVATPIPFAEIQVGETVLDLGCGGGLDPALAAQAAGPSGTALGIDMAVPMVGRAIATVRALNLDRAEAVVGIAEALPIQSSSVDCVVANGILSMSPDKPVVLAEIARVLKPGGRFTLAETTPRYELPPGTAGGLEDWFR